MNRRECLGSIAALFGGVVIPEAIRQGLVIIPGVNDYVFSSYASDVGEIQIGPDKQATIENIEAMLKEVFTKPIIQGMVSDAEVLRLFERADLPPDRLFSFDLNLDH